MATKKEIDELSEEIEEGPLLRIINLLAGEIFLLKRRIEKLEKWEIGQEVEPNPDKTLFNISINGDGQS